MSAHNISIINNYNAAGPGRRRDERRWAHDYRFPTSPAFQISPKFEYTFIHSHLLYVFASSAFGPAIKCLVLGSDEFVFAPARRERVQRIRCASSSNYMTTAAMPLPRCSLPLLLADWTQSWRPANSKRCNRDNERRHGGHYLYLAPGKFAMILRVAVCVRELWRPSAHGHAER